VSDRQPVAQVRCHSSHRAWAEAWFEGEIVIDDTLEPDTVMVLPLGYAKNITATIGFENPTP
jgi:hypothetical protein